MENKEKRAKYIKNKTEIREEASEEKKLVFTLEY